MLDIPSVSAVVAAIGVIIGVVFTVLELRNLVQQRQTALIMRLRSTWRNRELRESAVSVVNLKFKDYNEFAKKYPLWEGVGAQEVRAISEVCSFFDDVGVLLRRKLIDIRLVSDLFGSWVRSYWEKVKPLIEGRRKDLNDPTIYMWFECLYNEMQKRQQQLAKIR
jgi:hypothetical protein